MANRYQTIAAATAAYSADQATRAGRSLDELRAGGELVAERQRDREVGVEVQVIPGLVAQPAAGGPGRDGADPDQQQAGDGRHQHVRVAQQERRGLADHVGVRGDRVPPDDQQAVRDDEADRVAAAHGVPARQPVGADAALQRRDAGHQRDEHDDRVAGQQAGDPPGVGQPVAEPADRRRARPPEPDGGRRAGGDRGQHGGRMGPDRRGRGNGGGAGNGGAALRHETVCYWCLHTWKAADAACPEPWPFLCERWEAPAGAARRHVRAES